MRAALIALIRGYQWFVSPLLGPHCRFYPSCSQYACEAIARHGAARGIWLAVRRLLRTTDAEKYAEILKGIARN